MSTIDFMLRRNAALTVPCRYCGAVKGEPCKVPKSGYELTGQSAHHIRKQEAGLEPGR